MKEENIEYVGEGLAAGDCGIRIQRINIRDFGVWTCNVGLHNVSYPEQNHEIHMKVHSKKYTLIFDPSTSSITLI